MGLDNRRILIIDDNPCIHEDFRKILGSPGHDALLDAQKQLLFGETRESDCCQGFEVDTACQGEEGLEMIAAAHQQGRPYAMAFVDVRMPPGIDGVETIERAWPKDPDIQFVICSAYSDYTAGDVLRRLGVTDRLLMLRKPCDTAEILLMASALWEKWNLAKSVQASLV